MVAHVRADAGLPPWTLGLPTQPVRDRRDPSHAEAHSGRARAHLEAARPARRRHPARPPGRSRGVAEDPGSHQGRAAEAPDRRVLSPTSASRRIAASRELWRSGGATGKPLFYPRSAEDLDYNLGVGFRRIWPCIGARAGDVVHVSFPLGIHPVGQLIPRSAQMEGLATTWAGAGTTTPIAGPARTDPRAGADDPRRRCRATRCTSPTSRRLKGSTSPRARSESCW